jgi:hypothetical protein
MYWLHDYAAKAGFNVSDDGVISSDNDLKIPLENFADMIAHETLKQYIAGVCGVMRNGQTLH